MTERVTVKTFVDYFRYKKDNVYTVKKLSEKEKEFWSLDKNVFSRRKRYSRENKKMCFIAIIVNEVNIYDVIAMLFEFDEVRYIIPQKINISEECAKKREYLLYTDSNILSEQDYYFIENFEHIQYEINNVVAPDISENLDNYQIIDRSLVNYEKYMTHIGQAMVSNCISLQFSRGCQFNCAYCQKVYLSAYRNRSADNLFEEMNMYYNLGVKRFAFVDDLPNFNRSESIRFFKRIYNSGMKVQLFFPNGLRGDILDFEYIDYMIQAGTVNIDLALETASPRLQKLIEKNLNVDKLRENLEYLIRNYPDVILELQMMIGLPTETGEEAIESMNYIKSLKWIDFPYMHILKIYPNTPMASLAIKYGVSEEDIKKSNDLGYHELPETLPFSKIFVKKCQSDFLNSYFLNKERLNTVLYKQAKIMTEQEMIQKYDSYLPIKIQTLSDIENLAGTGKIQCVPEERYHVEELNRKISSISPKKKKGGKKYKIMFLDLTLKFNECSDKIYHVVEPPLGQMYILSYLNKTMGEKIEGKILKSGVDFVSYGELKKQIENFCPQFIGIRGMNYYKIFLHYTANLLRQWGYKGYIAVGGPYATSSYKSLLGDTNIDFAIIGEGEETFVSIINNIISNNAERICTIKGVVVRKTTLLNSATIRFINYL